MLAGKARKKAPKREKCAKSTLSYPSFGHFWAPKPFQTGEKPRKCQIDPILPPHFGPFGPKVANRVRKWVPGPSRPRGPKSPKQSRKRVKRDNFSTILTLFRLSFGLFGPWGPGTHFRTLFATFGPKCPNDPCSGQKFSQLLFFLRGRGSKKHYKTRGFEQSTPLPCVAKWLQTDLNYFRIIYGVTDTDFNYLELITGLQIQTWHY